MSLKDQDRKILWAKSGNMCSFPDCNTPLVHEETGGWVLGQEAHIKGGKPGSARYDPIQSPEERESYFNYILLCPTHHSMIDADLLRWTVEALHEMKAGHETQVEENKLYPQLKGDLQKLAKKFNISIETEDVPVSKIKDDEKILPFVRVDASIEGGVNTGIKVLTGQKMRFFARGLVSYDSRNNFATPEGILCTEYGLPYFKKEGDIFLSPVIFPHEKAYKTDGKEIGRVGSLIGWVNQYSSEKSFFIGTKRDIIFQEDGYLFLAVNDAKGTYGDNDGEFRVDIQILG